MPILLLKTELQMQTRCSNQIANELNHEAVPAGSMFAVEDNIKKFKTAIHRPVLPSSKYNCHGLTFASRRTKIAEAQEVLKILKDDDYTVVPAGKVLPGDIAVYYKDGDVDHSGIVVQIEAPFNVPIILSKWGFLQEAVHRVANCPYDASNVIYYRITS